jgi:hypothetical protein
MVDGSTPLESAGIGLNADGRACAKWLKCIYYKAAPYLKSTMVLSNAAYRNYPNQQPGTRGLTDRILWCKLHAATRVQAVKNQYDPTRAFHYAQSIEVPP